MRKQKGTKHTWIFHMREQPLHRSLGVAIARSEQRLLATVLGESHRLQLSQRGLVELRKCWGSCNIHDEVLGS